MTAPKLRFKEFDGDWNLSTLANISSIITGNTPSTSNREYYDGEFLFVSPADIQENRYIEKTKTTLTANGFSKCRHIPENSVLFVCIGSTIGKVAQNKVICATNQQINAVIPKKGYSSDFLYLQLERLAPNIKLNAGVQAVPLINKTEFGKTLLNTPTFIEQTKIASFLSAVDEKISQLTQKHELLSQYKQGMMQKLFSQQIRFKADDGSEFGEWKQSLLGQHCQITTGKLDANAMKEDGQYRFYTCAKDYYFIDNFAFDTEALLISGNGAHVGYIHYYKGKFNAYQRTYVLDNWKHNIQYVKYFMEKYLKARIYGEKKEGNTPYIVLATLSEMPFQAPCLEEQTKIANFLSAIDQKIDVVSGQLEQAKLWKKGLLQQMFV